MARIDKKPIAPPIISDSVSGIIMCHYVFPLFVQEEDGVVNSSASKSLSSITYVVNIA